MTGLVADVGYRADGHPALHAAGRQAARVSGYQRRAEAAGLGYAAATIAERDAGASDIARLVRRAAEGNRWAWERLVEQYERLIWAMTRDFKLVESDATDVAQITWLRCLSTSTGSNTRRGWDPGWRPPRETSACAASRRERGWCSWRTMSR